MDYVPDEMESDDLSDNEDIPPSSLAECFSMDPPMDDSAKQLLAEDFERRRQRLV